jgi:ABC-type bacteriocin/lantibiotic exporter with double-glycine peptidase domain
VLVLLPIAVVELVAPLIGAGEALARVEAAASRVRALLHRPDPVSEPERPAAPSGRADLTLHDVAVGWPDGPLQVRGVELRVAEGERVVVTGPSGSGKSTLAAALVRFLDPEHGTYAVGGVPAGDLGGDAVRRSVTWCEQDPWFADSTLADNLRIADPAATDEDLWAALDAVHLGPWARHLPRGLDTRLARDAATLSGGERQRLALARALVGGRRAVVFDEPTAHLDPPTAAAVGRDLLAATAERAVVLITHDPELAGTGPLFELVPDADGPARWRGPGHLPGR